MNDTTDDNRVKEHFAKYKGYYISAGVGVAVGIGVGLIFRTGPVSIANPAVINYKPVANTVQVAMVRPGPKAHIVQCVETQELFPSIRQACTSMSLNRNDMLKHLNGENESVKGFTFIKQGEV